MQSLGTTTDLEALTRIIDPVGLRWVDVGCGDGALARELVALGADEVAGIEPDPIQAEKNRTAELPSGVKLSEAAAESMPLENESADVVVFSYSLHHVPIAVMPAALAEARRVLKPAGRLCVVEPVAADTHQYAIELFHDETAVRAAALASLQTVARPHFETEHEYGYSILNRFSSFVEFCDYYLSKSYNRFDPALVRSDAVRTRFESCHEGDAFVLQQPVRVDLYAGVVAPG